MLKTTTSAVDGKEVADYLNVVGKAILDAKLFKNMFGKIRDIV